MEKKKAIAICVWGTANIGKSSTIREVYELLKTPKKTILEDFGDELYAIMEYERRIIGFYSYGDPDAGQDKYLSELKKKGCDIIICASRSKGRTVDVIKKKFDEIIWIHPFSISLSEGYDNLKERMNNTSAKHIIDIINQMI